MRGEAQKRDSGAHRQSQGPEQQRGIDPMIGDVAPADTARNAHRLRAREQPGRERERVFVLDHEQRHEEGQEADLGERVGERDERQAPGRCVGEDLAKRLVEPGADRDP